LEINNMKKNKKKKYKEIEDHDGLDDYYGWE